MSLMNNITKTLKETFKPRKRRAAIGGILGPIMIVVIVIAGVGVLAAMFFDLADTASVVDSIDILNPAVYVDQGYVTVQVKNNGNTAIEDVYAALLVDDTTACDPGTTPLLITQNKDVMVAVATTGDNVHDLLSLNPGDSVTISGGLRDIGTVTVSSTGDTDGATIAVITNFECDGKEIENRGEYILQISGHADGDIISKTVSIRAR